jgi:AcrR family transcriptional regulator
MTPARRAPEATAGLRASLAAVARDIVGRDGPAALTMRALAAEAGCSVGLVYKVFDDRADLVAAVIAEEYGRLTAGFLDLVAAAGTGTVGGNLAAWAALLLDSPAIALAGEVAGDERVQATTDAAARDTGLVGAIEGSVVDYLAAEQRLGRVDERVDVATIGFLVAGAIHNLLAAGDLYPRPPRPELERRLSSLADLIAPPTSAGDTP